MSVPLLQRDLLPGPSARFCLRSAVVVEYDPGQSIEVACAQVPVERATCQLPAFQARLRRAFSIFVGEADEREARFFSPKNWS